MKDQRSFGKMWSMYKKGGLTSAISSVLGAPNAQQVAFIKSMMKNQRSSSLLDIPLKELEIVVFDLETTGFSPRQDEIISVGGVGVVGGEMTDETFYSMVRPFKPVPPEIQKLTGITDQMVQEAPELIDVLHEFLGFVKKRVLIAHGTGHDKAFLNEALWKTSRIRLTHRVLDTLMIARWLLPDRESYCLDSLLETYDIPITRRHHALEDSKMTARLWKCFLNEILRRQVTTLGDLYAYLSR